MVGNKEIQNYLDSKKGLWAETTLRSEAARLNQYAKYIDGNALTMWDALKELKPYARVTAWTRVTAIWSFTFPHIANPYSEFRTTHAAKFRHAYVRQPASVDYDEVMARIEKIKDRGVRLLAKHLVQTGLRFSEAYNIREGQVVGKGGRPRPVLGKPIKYSDLPVVPYARFHRGIKKVGLKSHDLRKAFATRLVQRSQLNEFDLCKVMGWSSIETARSYVAARKDDELRQIISNAL